MTNDKELTLEGVRELVGDRVPEHLLRAYLEASLHEPRLREHLARGERLIFDAGPDMPDAEARWATSEGGLQVRERDGAAWYPVMSDDFMTPEQFATQNAGKGYTALCQAVRARDAHLYRRAFAAGARFARNEAKRPPEEEDKPCR